MNRTVTSLVAASAFFWATSGCAYFVYQDKSNELNNRSEEKTEKIIPRNTESHQEFEKKHEPLSSMGSESLSESGGIEDHCLGGFEEYGEPVISKPQKYVGKKTAIIDAINKIKPDDFSLVDYGLHNNKKISWSTTDTWPKALKMISEVSMSCISIDWEAKKIGVYDGIKSPNSGKMDATNKSVEVDASKSPPVAEATPPHVSSPSGIIQPTQAVSESLPAQPKSIPGIRQEIAPVGITRQEWRLEEGRTLQENLRGWADRAGWRLVWAVRGTEYWVTQPVVLQGSFLDSLSDVMAAYQDGPNPMGAIVYEGNHVIKIIDRSNFENNSFSN